MTKPSPKRAEKEAADRHPSANWARCIVISVLIIFTGSILCILAYKFSLNDLKECSSAWAIFVAGAGSPMIVSKVVKGISDLF